MSGCAVVLTNGFLETINAKTAHGMIRGPSRYRIAAVVDAAHAGKDAGEVVDGRSRGIPVVADLELAMRSPGAPPDTCVIGVATEGGRLPASLRADVVAAARAGLHLVNGLHEQLADDVEVAGAAREGGGRITDLRAPRPTRDLHFWTGASRRLTVPRVAVLGMDCAIGKRTTTVRLWEACRRAGLRCQLVTTGQTGWLQGFDHGFRFDATPNDFVSGELEHAVLSAAADGDPQLILIEGQSSLRNPSGPCGAEMLLSAGARAVVLQHAPGRRFHDGFEELGIEIAPLEREVRLIEAYGARVVAVTLHAQGMTTDALAEEKERLESSLGVPVLRPLTDEIDELVGVLRRTEEIT